MLNISQRSALSHIQLHDSGYFFFVSNRDHDSPTKQNNVWQNIIAAVYLKVFNLNELLNITFIIYLVNIKIMKKWFEWMIWTQIWMFREDFFKGLLDTGEVLVQIYQYLSKYAHLAFKSPNIRTLFSEYSYMNTNKPQQIWLNMNVCFYFIHSLYRISIRSRRVVDSRGLS